MQRFRGQPLREQPHIAVLVWDKPGNFVVSTVVLRALRERFPGCTIDFFGGERTREFEEASSLIDARFSLVGLPGGAAAFGRFVEGRTAAFGPYDLGLNFDFEPSCAVALGMLAPTYVVGHSYQADLRRPMPPLEDRLQELADDLLWNRASLASDYADVIGSGYIAELWCRQAGLVTDFTRPELPLEDPGPDVPEVLIATGGTRTTKLWPVEHWLTLARLMKDEAVSVGLVGVARSQQSALYGSPTADDDRLIAEGGVLDLRGRWTLPQVAGATRAARAVISIDNAIAHIAAAVGAPTITIWGGSPYRLWAARTPNALHVLPTEPCTMCEEARFKNLHCLRDRQVCTESIAPLEVFARLQSALRSRSVA